ncbi:MAG: AAA family ATPase [Actinobacteria bacterium]|jgi:DNA sulfur modification protein DndD|nr:AAA family ATPase [Actinomycetota bacterium]
MRIRGLEIQNYRQYRSLTLDLSDSRGDFVVVVGSNGAGKTNLLNAIIWCLYGREDYYSHDRDSSPMCSQNALDEVEDGDLLVVSVSLDLLFADGAEARVTRTQDFFKKGKATTTGPKDLQVIYSESGGGGHQSAANPEHWVEKWIPSRLEPYFLFDGERLETFFRHAEEQKVRDAVLQIAQIDLLERLNDHLYKVSGQLYSRAAKERGGAETQQLGARLEEKQKKLEKNTEELARRRESVAELEQTMRSLDSRIGDIATVVGDIERRRTLQGQLSQIESHLKEAWGELFGWSSRVAPVIIVAPALHSLQKQIEEARANRRLPPPISAGVLERLLRENACVCGASLEEGSEGRRHIEHLLAEYARVSQVGSEMLDLEQHLRKIAGVLEETEATADSITRRIADWTQRLQRTTEDLDLLNAKLAGHKDAEVAQLQKEIQKARKASLEENRRITHLDIDCGTLKSDIAHIEKELERIAGREEKTREAINQARFAAKCLEVSKGIYKDLTDRVRTTVATTLERSFKEMIWKRDFYESVKIDEQYRVSVWNRFGFEVLEDLSAGERECLALAFAIALSEVAGYELPMVIDTPMGKLSPDVQKYVSQVLVDNMKIEDGRGHQLIMLMTETEYNKEVAEVLSQRSPKIFDIKFDTKCGCSDIVEVG